MGFMGGFVKKCVSPPYKSDPFNLAKDTKQLSEQYQYVLNSIIGAIVAFNTPVRFYRRSYFSLGSGYHLNGFV